VTKRAKEFTDAYGNRRVKGNMDIEIAVDAMEMAGKVDRIVLFSGDGDFRRLVEAVQREGARGDVVSTLRSSPPMPADELRDIEDAAIADAIRMQEDVGLKAVTDGEYFYVVNDRGIIRSRSATVMKQFRNA